MGTILRRVEVCTMKLNLTFLTFLLLTGFATCFETNKLVPHQTRADSNKLSIFVETYWESWIYKDYPQDYCAEMKDVPASPVGSTSGANIINISFADYTGGFNGIECDISNVVAGIEAVHQAGGLVKVAFGGALYSMSLAINDQATAEEFCDSVVQMREEYHIDGIDLDIEDGGTSAKLQIHVLKSCREKLGPDFLITYTLPALSSNVEPWMGTIRDGGQFLDYINVMAYDVYWTGYDYVMDIEALESIGIAKSKIVLGIMPGHHDAGNEYTSIEDAQTAAIFAKEQGLGGVMTWDINRDCDQRMNYAPGQDNLYQTGQPRAAFVDLLSQTINL